MRTEKLEVLQVLRGLASVLVVLYHFKEFLVPSFPQVNFWLGFGYIGVDIFFVISGFIIYISTVNPASREARSFVWRRFCRVILPAWMAMLFAVLVQPPYLRDLILSVLFIPLRNGDSPFYGHSILLVAWTLTYELIFYAIFALVLTTKIGRRFRGLICSAILFLLVCIGQTRGFNMFDTKLLISFHSNTEYFPDQLVSLMGNPMFMEFIVGIFFAWIYQKRWISQRYVSIILLSCPLVFYFIVHFQFETGHGLTRGGVLGAAIVAFALCYQIFRDALPSPYQGTFASKFWNISVYIGEISFSIYLIHLSIMVGILRYGSSLGIDRSWVGFIAALLVTFVVAPYFYRSVELQSQRLGRYLSERYFPKVALSG